MITIENLNYWIGKKEKPTFQLSIANLVIKKGQVIGLIGKNGSGKSTLIDLICGNRHLSEGTIKFNSDSYLVSAVFQESLFDNFSLGKLLNLFSISSKSSRNLDKLLLDFDLKDLITIKFQDLSFGQKQRFRFMIALLKNYDLLILDEIMTGIDYEWQQKIKITLDNNIAKQKTIIIISHNIEEIVSFCNRVIFLNNGKIEKDFELLGNKNEKQKVLKDNLDFLPFENNILFSEEWEY